MMKFRYRRAIKKLKKILHIRSIHLKVIRHNKHKLIQKLN